MHAGSSVAVFGLGAVGLAVSFLIHLSKSSSFSLILNFHWSLFLLSRVIFNATQEIIRIMLSRKIGVTFIIFTFGPFFFPIPDL